MTLILNGGTGNATISTTANSVSATQDIVTSNITSSGNVSVAGLISTNTIASANNLIIATGGSNTVALTIDQYQQSDFNGGIREKITVSAANATANVNFDVIDQGILYYTANASANTTINIRGNSTVTLNTLMAVNETLSAVFMSTNGATARWVNGYQVDGAAVTPRWQGGTAPTGGNANAIDVYVFTVIKTANAAFTVLGSQTQFK
jgi:hypothetical protein